MMARVVWDKDAIADLDEIWLFIAKGSPNAANRWIDLIEEKCEFLAAHSDVGEARPELGDHLRSFSVGSYVIYFVPNSNGIGVAPVLHGGRDVRAIF